MTRNTLTTVLRTVLLWGLVVAFAACREGAEAPLSDAERRSMAARVDSLTGAFEAAQRSRDPERTVGFLAPDFYMYVDGVRSGYDSVAARIRRTLGAMQHVEPGFENVEVRVLGRDAALVSLVFRDSVITASGQTQQSRGPTTLIWERRQDQWRIVYADADHYPVAPY